MEYRDYYQIMGLARDAKQDEIKRAYRKLARKFHPDVNKDASSEDKFKELTEAYEVLKDPEKRAAYDRLGSDWQAGQEFRPPPNWDENFEFSGRGFGGNSASGFSDFFEDLFGHNDQGFGFVGDKQGFHNQHLDHHAKILIDLEDSFNGASRSITLQSPTQNKRGEMVTQDHVLNVKIPRGICHGQHIRLRGQGGAAADGKRGDLYLEVAFRVHPIYRIKQRNLEMDLPVAPWEAALGAIVRVPTPAGIVELKIPKSTQADRKFRLAGRGLPGKTADECGDLYAVIKVSLPTSENSEAERLYREMQREIVFNPRAKLGV